MTARDAANAALDTTVEGIATDATTAAELFAVVDLLDGQPMLRRSLSDPSSTDVARAGLAKRLLTGKVSATTLEVVAAVVSSPWSSANALVAGLERQGIRVALSASRTSGGLERVEEEVRQLLPQARTAVFSSDTVPDGKSARALIQSMADGEIDIADVRNVATSFPGFDTLARSAGFGLRER